MILHIIFGSEQIFQFSISVFSISTRRAKRPFVLEIDSSTSIEMLNGMKNEDDILHSNDAL